LISVAILTELQHTGSRFSGVGGNLLICLAGWIVAIASWLIVAWLAPLVTDNRRRLDIDPYEVDVQL
jgi:hypothetical protein